MLAPIEHRIALELNVRPAQVNAAIALLDEGATVPFIARYRKEVTGGLDDTQLRTLEERLGYLRELEDRRAAILASIDEQGKLTPELKAEIDDAETKQRLEDLYLPYKQKRRTKAQIAREAGIEPLALGLLENPELAPEDEAEKYLNAEAGFADTKAVLDGARQILMEKFAEDADLLRGLREYLNEHGHVRSQVVEGKETEGAKFRDWFDFAEPIANMPSHRALALLRGRNEGVLGVTLVLDSELDEENIKPGPNPCEQRIAARYGIKHQNRPADKWLQDTVRWTWKVKVYTHLELELMNELRERAEEEAIRIFGKNLKDLLLAAPAGQHVTMGVDPGIRTGCKIAVVDATGKLLDTATIYPHEPRNDWAGSISTIARLASTHGVSLVAIGNGTASRETDKLVLDVMKKYPEARLTKIVVSEAGASVYSASELAAKEFPDLDVSIRGAVSIARRLQDPLAELVKIEPKSIGVGQYQHDVSQTKLARNLDAVVEDCVNAVGVDVNTASVPLLTRISGLNAGLAANIVGYRDANGAFRSRDDLKKVPRLGDKTFEQAAGFLRVPNGDNPLDASSVHPEAYPLVEKIIVDLKKPIKEIMGDGRLLKSLNASKFTDDRFGLPTVQDIFKELEKPGRDPRPEFKTATFADGVEKVSDLRPGMILEGVVTNVAAFGAFVDIGVHQDGLVHVSALSNTFVKDPHEVVKAGQVVKVKVLEVDLQRQRIALTMCMGDEPTQGKRPDNAPANRGNANPRQQQRSSGPAPSGNAMAAAFAKLRK
ncbi:RNA-binding transcriptional accessory protein [Dechloromonas sp. XY25]|uniref:RNA-binding transcriptional accessory protein n=1 Tax=Dechloromonas hankyongensis TaxID=2908002 RepID=A0ABS9K4A3_9RHOO|nr:Tex family protein [Dechloromonas hankyongensis]MCG2577997.1 RNA-binding transcriptional accessory protein [Dechloromonas hankyongensis]